MERMTASDFDPELLGLFDRYVHGGISRRAFLDGAARFAVGGLTAAAIMESLGPNYAWAQQVPKDDARIKAEYTTYPSPQGHGSIRAYRVRPADDRGNLPGVVVIHENRGLNPYIEDVARRLGVAAYIYEGTNHGFHNDTTPRYDNAAATLAWARTIEFLNRTLK